MRERWAGPIVVVIILGGVMAVLALNLNLKGRASANAPAGFAAVPQSGGLSSPTLAPVAKIAQPVDFREYPIGDEVEKNGMLIKAVWLPPIQMEGMDDAGSSKLIHLEADVHATEGNPNGFAKDEFVPYLIVRYTITPVNSSASSGLVKPLPLTPMVARDGLHYGATIEAPAAGHYRLTYAIEPPSAGGLGRHVDPATGVAPWWKPFEVAFDWDFDPK